MINDFMTWFLFLPYTEIVLLAVVTLGIVGVICRLLNRAKHFTDYIPALMTSLGILGTFLGIVAGLFNFDPKHVDASIGQLLEGLKTAFYTSIIGIIGSIVFKVFTSFFPHHHGTDQDNDVNDDDVGFAILTTLKKAEETSATQNELLNRLIASIGGDGDSSLVTQLRTLRDEVRTQDQQRQTRFDTFAQNLNQQLVAFNEKLSESATKVIIEALNQVIADFNKNLTEQFGQNFKELNQAVERLVVWQVQYKAHIESLEGRYERIAQTLSTVQTSLEQVAQQCARIDTSMTNFDTVTDKHGQSLTQLQKQLSELTASLASLEALRQGAQDAVPTLTRTITQMSDDLRSGADHLSKAIDQTATSFTSSTTATCENLQQSTAQINQSLNAIDTSFTKLEGEVKTSLQAVGQHFNTQMDHVNESMKTQFNDAIQTLRQGAEALNSEIGRIEKQMGATGKIISENLDSAGQSLLKTFENNMGKVVRATEERQLQMINESMNKLNNTFNETLGKLDEGMTKHLNDALSQLGVALGRIASRIQEVYNQTNRQHGGR